MIDDRAVPSGGTGTRRCSSARSPATVLLELVDDDRSADELARVVRVTFDDPDIHRVEVRVPAAADRAREVLGRLGAVHEATLRTPSSGPDRTAGPVMILAVHRDELAGAGAHRRVVTVDHDRLEQRVAGDADVEALFEIERSAFGVGYDRGQLRQLIALFPGLVRLAVIGGAPVGYSLCGIVHDDPATAWLLSMGVRREWQGAGVGTSLLTRALDELRRRGTASVRLTVDPRRARTVAFYTAAGFRPVEQVSDYFGPGEARSIMVREL